jgi:3-hydroxyisobutyrate dehydrogenase
MANNLLKAGYEVIAFDVNHSNLSKFESSGGKSAENPRVVAAAVQTVITMLPSNPHVRQVYMGDKGILSEGGARSGSLLIDCSTCEPAVCKEVAQAANKRGITLVDAPVSGGTIGAEQATLTFMVGGPDDGFQSAKSILGHMGKKVVHCGDVGMGQAAKLCNNLVLGITMAAVCEGHALADRLGLDQKMLAEILNTSSARCWSSDTYNPCPGVMDGVPSSRGYTGGFACDLMLKDLGLATSAAFNSQPKLGLPMAGLALQLYSQMSARGGSQKDFSGLYEHIVGVQKSSSSK